MAIGRNDPCPCGSGRKHKKCCIQAPQKTGFTASSTKNRQGNFFDQSLKEPSREALNRLKSHKFTIGNSSQNTSNQQLKEIIKEEHEKDIGEKNDF